jgi:hypothetical protein
MASVPIATAASRPCNRARVPWELTDDLPSFAQGRRRPAGVVASAARARLIRPAAPGPFSAEWTDPGVHYVNSACGTTASADLMRRRALPRSAGVGTIPDELRRFDPRDWWEGPLSVAGAEEHCRWVAARAAVRGRLRGGDGDHWTVGAQAGGRRNLTEVLVAGRAAARLRRDDADAALSSAARPLPVTVRPGPAGTVGIVAVGLASVIDTPRGPVLSTATRGQ